MSPRPWYFSQKRESAGTSSTQGGHHVAQKWMIVILPWSFERSTLAPARSATDRFGTPGRKASDPEGEAGGSSDFTQTPAAAAAARAKATIRRVRVFMGVGSSGHRALDPERADRKSTRLNSSHLGISY